MSRAVVVIQMDHYSPVTEQIKILNGKGREDRIDYPLGNLKKALDRWVALRGNAPGPLFCPVKTGRLLLDRKSLIPHSVFYILKRLAKQADLQISFSPHDHRRTYISNLIDLGADLVSVQGLAGHADISTTA
jgi:site-specific recombinase XerD